ncbi:hypothetical protein [Paenibacillus cymbidii]|uniref:hypothetical protein n=1 Tax=Paenibacillus cymbidii TaxID=1639034 RepID=UPI001080BEC5|nr:hypothetical protein [Paenibacillus cymbidii]
MSTAIREKPSNLQVFPLTFLFFATAIVMFMIGMIAAINWVPNLSSAGQVRGPEGWMLAHLFLLGWVSMMAMGANFQLIQVILNTKLFSRALGFVHYLFYTVGLILSLIGFYRGDSDLIAIGGSLIAIGVLLFVFNMAMTMVRKRKWNVFVFGVSASMLNFVMVVSLGVMQGISIGTGWGSSHYDRMFMSHLWLGMAGWMSGLIVTYSFKLLPMFYVSRKKPAKDAYWIIGLLQGGVWLKVGGIWFEVELVEKMALVSVMIAMALMTLFVIRVQGKGKPPGGAVPVAANLIPAVAVLLWIWGGQDLFSLSVPLSLTPAFGFFLICGWFTTTTLSYLSKIVPFLWWAYRFHTKWQKKNVVLLSEMTPDRRMIGELVLFLGGVIVVCVSFLIQRPELAMFGQIVSLCALVAYIAELVRIFRY